MHYHIIIKTTEKCTFQCKFWGGEGRELILFKKCVGQKINMILIKYKYMYI
jgi:hypothetical protein